MYVNFMTAVRILHKLTFMYDPCTETFASEKKRKEVKNKIIMKTSDSNKIIIPQKSLLGKKQMFRKSNFII